MNIAPVSSSVNTNYSTLDDNSIIRLLEKQKMELQDQIQKTNESKLDDKTKQERIKQLQDQIQQIDAEIQQKRAEKLNRNQNTNTNTNVSQQKVNSPSNGGSNGNSTAGMPDLVQASLNYSEAKAMNGIKNNLNNNGRILKKEIELDEARSKTGHVATLKRQQLAKIESREQDLNNKISQTDKNIQKEVNKASDRESENNRIDAENKGKEEDNTKNSIKDSDLTTQEMESTNNSKEAGKNYKGIDVRV